MVQLPARAAGIARRCHTRERPTSILYMLMPSDSADLPPFDVESIRPRLFGIAYRMLSDANDANDLVQEAFLRWHQTDQRVIQSAEAWLVAVTSRLAIDRLRRAATERAAYVGNWLPTPILTEEHEAPSYSSELASDLSMALLVLLERLAPEERIAFLLREVFDTPYEEIATIIEKSEAATRQLVHRARTRVRSERARFTAPPAERERLLERFLAAVNSENKDELVALFTDDATFTSDGGGKVSAARNVLVGPDRISRFLLGIEHKARDYPVTHALRTINGEMAMATYVAGNLYAVTAFQTDGERITAVYRVLNPDKLTAVATLQ